jgi:signal transduction histidine kinase/Fe-S-cluster-containing hydrogenase component 2
VTTLATETFVETIPDRCRTCYTCVRECPAKAIRIREGQAQIVDERCIGCGNCVRVCSQGAKRIVEQTGRVQELLSGDAPVAAMIAPSFPAEFPEVDHRHVVGALRALGFAPVVEVAFGADLVAARYSELASGPSHERHIATACPAVVRYVERHHPEMIDNLAPIVSPMIATARVLRQVHGHGIRTVFIGPCAAKKGEAGSGRYEGEVDVALTFGELHQVLEHAGIAPQTTEPTDFDPPRPGLGAVFPVGGGLFQAAGLSEDITEGEIVSAKGRTEFVDAVREFSGGSLEARLLDVLCCDGCTMGPGMRIRTPAFRRRAQVAAYAKHRAASLDRRQWCSDQRRFANIDLACSFEARDQRLPEPTEEELTATLQRLGKTRPQDELDCRACGYETCREHARAILLGLAEREMCLPYAIDELHRTVGELAASHRELASTQEALMQSEKLAGLGQLAAGIAHEVNNPLGIILMYTHLIMDELDGEAQFGSELSLISEQAERCKRIVAGLLDFSREQKISRLECDPATILDRAIRGVPRPNHVELVVDRSEPRRRAELDADQMVQVLTNLLSNAYQSMPKGGRVTLRLGGDDQELIYTVQDEGCGIPRDDMSKIFEPFFTTKTLGAGIGLGLSVAYGIVKMHQGEIEVESNADPSRGPTGTTFIVKLPREGAGD